MIKVWHCFRRQPQLTAQEFQAHWLEYNAALSREVTGLRRCVQYHSLANELTQQIKDTSVSSGGLAYDGFEAQWWDSVSAAIAAAATRQFKAWQEDRKMFVDGARSTACVADEFVVVEPEGLAAYVLIKCLGRSAELDRAAFQKIWRETQPRHGQQLHASGFLTGYTQDHVPLLAGDSAQIASLGIDQNAWDGIGTIYLHTLAKFKALAGATVVTGDSLADQMNFIDFKRTVSAITRRHVIKDVVR